MHGQILLEEDRSRYPMSVKARWARSSPRRSAKVSTAGSSRPRINVKESREQGNGPAWTASRQMECPILSLDYQFKILVGERAQWEHLSKLRQASSAREGQRDSRLLYKTRSGAR